MQISMAIPAALKQQLIKDHDAIKEGKNIPMPRTPCVHDILERYKANARERAKGTTPDVEEQVANGLRSYFDKTLAVVRFKLQESDFVVQQSCCACKLLNACSCFFIMRNVCKQMRY